jgi:hypothetical protein
MLLVLLKSLNMEKLLKLRGTFMQSHAAIMSPYVNMIGVMAGFFWDAG